MSIFFVTFVFILLDLCAMFYDMAYPFIGYGEITLIQCVFLVSVQFMFQALEMYFPNNLFIKNMFGYISMSAFIVHATLLLVRLSWTITIL